MLSKVYLAEPYTEKFGRLGYFKGLKYVDGRTQKPLSHFFGGVRYGLSPAGQYRWRKPRRLPENYVYGSKSQPAICTGGTKTCPQVQSPYGENVGEDCLQLNIWRPAERPPKHGWPVMFNIHGGFLQFGNPNNGNLSAFLSETECKCVVVMPAYRLNLFGFLSSEELIGGPSDPCGANYGFWDQRLALEWTYENIEFFGGNRANITMAGYSAGSQSAFHQLAFDVTRADRKIVKRAIMWSNGPGLQPKSMEEAKVQFDEFTSNLDIPKEIPRADKLDILRSLSPEKLLAVISNMKYHQFRPTSDDGFLSSNLFNSIDNGDFAQQMRQRNIRLLIGECADERFVYGTWKPPSNSLESLFERLQADYPRAACEALVAYYYPNGQLPSNCKDWPEAFGRLYADIQIHMMERGLVNQLARHGLEQSIYRYRVEWRAKFLDRYVPPEWGVTHGTDLAIWFFGEGEQLTPPEKRIVKTSFLTPLAKFLKGEEDVDWGTSKVKEVRRLRHDGNVDIWHDQLWEKGLEVWKVLRKVDATGGLSEISRL